LKAFHHIVASSAEIVGAFNTGFETFNLHLLTLSAGNTFVERSKFNLKAKFVSGSSHSSFKR
jgi:hypothetical protein